jgi:hypothetical protein
VCADARWVDDDMAFMSFHQNITKSNQRTTNNCWRLPFFACIGAANAQHTRKNQPIESVLKKKKKDFFFILLLV